jgi:hypothetical protein
VPSPLTEVLSTSTALEHSPEELPSLYSVNVIEPVGLFPPERVAESVRVGAVVVGVVDVSDGEVLMVGLARVLDKGGPERTVKGSQTLV